MQALLYLALAYLQLFLQQGKCVVHRLAQHVAHGEEVRLPFVDDAAVGRDADLAVGEGVERVDGLVGRGARRQVYQYLYAAGGEVLHFADFDFPLLAGFHDGVAYARHGLSIRNLLDGKRLVVYLLYLGTHAHAAAALAVVVFGDVDAAARLKVGIELELLVVQVADGGVAQFVEVVRQYLG